MVMFNGLASPRLEMNNDIRISERIHPQVNSPKTKAQELLINLAINCLQNQASGNNVTATASLAILQAIAIILIGDQQNKVIENQSKDDNLHEAMKFARCLLEGKSDLIGNEVAVLHNIWLRNGPLKLSKKVQNLIATHYSCETKVLPLANNNIDVAKLKKKLRKLDQPGRFHEEFRTAVFCNISPQDIFLTSAVHIEMAWREPFSENLTTKGTFHVSREERIETDMMVTKCGLVCVACDDINATVLQLPLTAHNISMLVYLPYTPKDLDAIPTKFTPEVFGKLVIKIEKGKPKPVYVSLPKITLKQSGVLSANLYETTETKTSQREANSTPVCKIFQTTTLRVNEYGLNTIKPLIGQEDTMAGPAVHDGIKWTNFTTTSPFLFMLVDMEYKLIFLTGKVTRPEQASKVQRRKSGRRQNRDWCCF